MTSTGTQAAVVYRASVGLARCVQLDTWLWFVRCQSMNRTARYGDSRSRNAGWNGDVAFSNPGIVTRMLRTGFAGSVAEMVSNSPPSLGTTFASIRPGLDFTDLTSYWLIATWPVPSYVTT